MPSGPKPLPPGEAVAPRNAKHKWQFADGEGWQHGRRPNPPSGLTDAGKKAWQTWLGSWWAAWYTPDDLPGLELTVRTYDAALGGHIDVAKVTPLLDRYGITPKGRQDLRWARQEAAPAEKQAPEVSDEVAERRTRRASNIA